MSHSPTLILGVVLARWSQSAAGHVCSVMNWALGFRALGWDVWLVENIDREKLSPPRTPGGLCPEQESFAATAHEFGFAHRASLLIDGELPPGDPFSDFAANADLFLNYSGQFNRLDLLASRTRKLYLDVDPAFTQLWVDVCGSDMNLEGHDAFLTVGTNLNGSDALLPLAGRTWIPTAPPVVADYWRERLGKVDPVAPDAAWTTVGHWYGYPEMEWQGRTYGGKRESFLSMRDLPTIVDRSCVIATDLQKEWDDYPPFHQAGWKFLVAATVCRDVPTYLRFIAASQGEIGIAKTGYITSRGGWLSDRSMIYLALGRPVLLHDTGWPQVFPSGAGLLPFDDIASCAAGMRKIESDPATHSRAAQELADEVFAAKKVIPALLERVG